ncbi:lipoprotein [Candidatus Regiella insecticola]|nr:lipoprotein [Candidatus Regiella insecticola]
MKKVLYVALVLLFAVIMINYKSLMQYSISEQKINQALQRQNNYQKQIGLPGLLDAQITLSQLKSQIGHTAPNEIQLTANAKVVIGSLLGSQNADITLTLKTQPLFDGDKGAIFLKEITLTDYVVQPEQMGSAIKMLIPYLNQSLKLYFNQQPVYVLSADKSTAEAIAKKLAKGLEVKPGELIISFVKK